MERVARPAVDNQRTRAHLQNRQWRELSLHHRVKIFIIGILFCFLFRNDIESIVRLWITDPSWSHGFLIPLFSLYFINQKRQHILTLQYVADPLSQILRGRIPQRLAPGQTRPNYLGFLILILTIAFYIFNTVSPAGYAYFRPISMIVALCAVVLFLGGSRLLKHTWLAIVFLIFAIPLPRRYYVGLTMPMRYLAAKIAAVLLNLVGGMEATANGAIIDVVYKGRHLEPALDVAEACSGMRLLMAFLALGVAMAYLHYRPLWQRLVLLASTIPIAILCNIVRVAVTGFIYVLIDPKYTQGIYHDTLGLAMLPLAFGLYYFLAWFMESLFVEDTAKAAPDVVFRKSNVQ